MSFIRLYEMAAADVPIPPADRYAFFFDSATGEPSYKDDAGVVTSMVGIPGVGVPAGGTTGQVLAKSSGTDYDTEWTTAGVGDVVGPASSVAGRIATYSDTTGKLLADGGKSIADLRAPNIQSVTSSATVTPTFDNDMVKITAQAAGLTLANPTGTAIPGLGMVIRIKDNGTARSISYGTQYRAIGITLPSTTVINKTTYIAMIYNSDDTTWDCIATGTQA